MSINNNKNISQQTLKKKSHIGINDVKKHVLTNTVQKHLFYENAVKKLKTLFFERP